jgi:hypothetical protein
MIGAGYPAQFASYARVLDQFEEGKARGNYWYTKCPAHEDGTPSLSFWIGDGGKLLFGCHAGCEKRRILEVMGLKWGDFFPDSGEKYQLPRIVKTYDYRDHAGDLVYQVCRLEPKSFRQRRSVGGVWTWNMDGIERILYRLPELAKADPSKPVLIVEGEKDCDMAWSLGWVSTTNAGGANATWEDSFSIELWGRHCVVMPDHDIPGIRRGQAIVGSLIACDAASVAFALAPISCGKDLCDMVTNFKQNGFTHEQCKTAVWSQIMSFATQWAPTQKE